LILGGIARFGAIAARAAVKDQGPPSGGEGVLTLVLDGEHGAIRCRDKVIPPLFLSRFME
jgi:hypothetical protein